MFLAVLLAQAHSPLPGAGPLRGRTELFIGGAC
jgi:hypothetical protein